LYNLTLKPIIGISLVQVDPPALLESKKAFTTSKFKASLSLDTEVGFAGRHGRLLLLDFNRISESWCLSSKSEVLSLLDKLGNDGGNLRMNRSGVRNVIIARTQEVLAKDVNELRERKLGGAQPLKKTNKDVLAHQWQLMDHNTILSETEWSAADGTDTNESRKVLGGNNGMRKGFEIQNKKTCNNLCIINRRNRAIHSRSWIVCIKSGTKRRDSRIGKRHIEQRRIGGRAICKNLKGMVNNIRHQCTWGNCFAKRKTKNAISCWRGYTGGSNCGRNLSIHHHLLLYSQN
jgi:hypothetical protein